MFNRSHTHVDILSDRPGFRVVYGDDTVATETRNIELVVPRSREPLELHYDVGRGFADTLIRARMSGTAWLNFENAFLGLIIDKKRDKGYTYRKVRLYKTYRKGYLSLSPMIMFGNLFQQESHAWGRVNNGGFWGIGLGMDYYYTDSKFVMMNYGVAINFPLPFPAPIDYEFKAGDYRYTTASNLFSLTDNFRFHPRFSIGYGLGATNHLLRRFDYYGDGYSFDPDYDGYTVTDDRYWSFGLAFALHWYVGERFHFQLNYQPTLLQTGVRTRWVYEHTLNLNLRLNLWLNRRR